jgi:hypothetical protein
MGAWGTAISSNDTYADVYSAFFVLYNQGMDVIDISNKLVADNQETIKDKYDSNNFWFALAKAQWECKQLDTELFNRVRKTIVNGLDLEIWEEVGANKKDLIRRKLVLDKFLVNLCTERPKARLRKRTIIRQPAFEKGDCLTFKLENGNFGGAVVLEAIKNSEYGYSLVAATKINQREKPNKKVFEDAEVLVMNYANHKNKPGIYWYLPIRHNQVSDLIEKVSQINVKIDYGLENSQFGFISDFDGFVILAVDLQLKFEGVNTLSVERQTIKEYIVKKKSRFWL